MTSKKIAVLVLVLVCLVLALAVGIISAPDVSEGSVMIPAVKNASVSPAVGNYTDSFNYSVEVRFYEEAEIVLQIKHPIEGKFKPYEVRKYTGSRGWQTLWWNGTTFGHEWVGEDVKYFFSCKGAELLFGEGPHIREELTWEFRNESVEPAYGNYTTPFTYSVEVKSNKEEEIHLEIFNMSSSKWYEPGEPKDYTENGTWHPLIWPNISNIASEDCKGGHSSFRFFFRESKDKYESDTVDYPIIYPTDEEIFKNATEEIFKNATVDPHAGYYDTAFTYSVEANTSGDVYLLIYDISIDKWQKEINGTNTSDNRREWKNISFSTACEGLVSYKFVAGTHESGIFYGPTLKIKSTSGGGGGGGGGGGSYKPYMLYENVNVEPNDWTIKGAIESKTFYYSVEVDKKDMLILEVYNPARNEWVEKGKGNGSKLKGEWSKWRHEWNVTLTLDKNWAGYGKYRFYPEKWEKYASQVYYGPEIKMLSLTEWKEEIGFSDRALAEPEIEADVRPGDAMWFKEFTYTANITHLDRANMTVALFVYKPGSNDWKPVPWRGYTYNPIVKSTNYNDLNTATISWTVEKSEIFDYKDGGEEPEKESMFYVWYWDGCNEYEEITGGYFHGPRLLANHEPEFIEALPVSPGNGSTHAVYEYTFEVNEPDNETVHGYLTVIDPLGNERKFKEDPGKKGYIQFTIDPDQRVFTEEKLREYTKITGKKTFTSSYKLELWDDGMIANRTEAKIEPPEEGWFMGPHVSLVKVIPVVTELNPKQGKYNAEYEFIVGIKSTKKNKLLLTLNISDPSNPEHSHQTFTTRNISVATDTIGYATWRVKPTIFRPDDFGKTARYEIAWEDQYGNKGIINGTGPYIERAVPLSSFGWPLMPGLSIVIVPALVFVFVLLAVLLNAGGKFKGILKLMEGIKGIKRGESGEKGEKGEGKKRGGNGE